MSDTTPVFELTGGLHVAEQKGLGSKLLGIFVEAEDDATAVPEGKSPAEMVAELASQTGPAAAPAGPALRLDKMKAPDTSGPIDFDAIFREAGMDAGDLDRVKKAEELLRGLPEATPQPVKKQIVEAALKAFGFDVAKIVLAAQNQKRALDAYVKVNEQATTKAQADAEAQIRAYSEKIAALKGDIERRQGSLAGLSTAATERKGQVQKVLEFFQPASPPTP